MSDFNGLGMNMANLARLSRAKSRSISAENFTGEKGAGGMATEGTGADVARGLGQGWKVSPSIHVPASSTVTLAEMDGPGAIQQMWMTVHPTMWRALIFRIYWDDEETPSVEVPIGDFFCNGWGERANLTSLAVCVNPAGGFNSYWEMPFRKSARITLENIADVEVRGFYYQINYALTDVPEDAAYFHAQWRRSNPLAYKDVHTILEGVEGWGHYVGTYLAWQVNNNGWWGEGEIKFYMDGDKWPTVCGTGTEDYFGGAWNFEHPKGEYGRFSGPYTGLHQIIKPDGLYRANQRFGMYRWHITDPVRFEEDLRVTIQALGWHHAPDGTARYLPLKDDIASVGYWYQQEPHAAFPVLPGPEDLEVI